MNLDGAIDLHVHSAPDVYPRSVDDAELAAEAEAAGMRALLIKSHHTLTADRATMAAKGRKIDVFGGVALNRTVGGLNPVAAETAVEFGAREIWMPTIHAAHCMEVAEAPMFRAEVDRGRRGIRVVGPDGRLRSEVLAVLEVVRDADVILGTGHLAPAESLQVLAAARDMGLSRMLVTHPLMAFTRFTADQMREAVRLGAVLEFDYLECNPRWHNAVDPDVTAAAIRSVGPRHAIMATDGGQDFNPTPVRMFQAFADVMSARGIQDAELRTMMCDNPARLLGL